jgi:quercetin dioxygenase-like cupin family protein
MMFAAWLRPHRVLMAVVAVAAGALACRDTTTSGERSTVGITEPRFTLGVGFTSTAVGRGNLGTFNVRCKADGNDGQVESHDNTDGESKPDGYCAQLKSKDNTDIVVANVTITPGGHSGWHSHPGPVIVVVKTGTVTFYHGNDPTCTGTVHPAGTAFIEEGGDVGIARNEGAVVVNNVVTYFVPASAPQRIDVPVAPGNCAF